MVGSFDAGYGSWYLEDTIGRKRAKEMWYLNRKYTAVEALEMGLVNEVVDAGSCRSGPPRWRGSHHPQPAGPRGHEGRFSARHNVFAGQARMAHDQQLTLYLQTREAHEMSEASRSGARPRPKGSGHDLARSRARRRQPGPGHDARRAGRRPERRVDRRRRGRRRPGQGLAGLGVWTVGVARNTAGAAPTARSPRSRWSGSAGTGLRWAGRRHKHTPPSTCSAATTAAPIWSPTCTRARQPWRRGQCLTARPSDSIGGQPHGLVWTGSTPPPKRPTCWSLRATTVPC
jgi:hypothetical protein